MAKFFRSFIKHFLWVLNILAVVLLLCTKAIPIINPKDFWLFGLLGLAAPIIAAINFLFCLLWMFFGKWRRVLLSAVVIIICWNIFSVCLAANFSGTNSIAKNDSSNFSVMSYNVRLMDYYNWSKKKSTRQEMLAFIKNQDASIICLQEFFSSIDSTGIQNVKDIAQQCGYNYNAGNKNFITKRGFFGDIIFSKYPIVAQASLPLDTSNVSHYFQYADIALPNGNIRLYNLHMQSVRFAKEDIALLENKTDSKLKQKDYIQGKIIINKLKTSYGKRGQQTDIIAQHIASSIYPVIICGDLNDMPSSYTYFGLRGNLNDAFLDKGFGFGRTFNSISTLLRIDNIFYDAKVFRLNGFVKKEVSYSDHYPIVASFKR